MARRGERGRFHVGLLAGGSGTRFWPLSRRRHPKQLLPLAGDRPLLVDSWRRARKLVPPARLWVITPRPLVGAVRALLPGLRPENIVVEPSPRDTGPAVALACATVARRDAQALLGIFPTDHVVRDEPAFVGAVEAAADSAARHDALVCLGVRPDRPATGFGYLCCAVKPARGRSVPVERFVEKPDRARARRFVASGRYLWNAGMFVWKVERFLREIGRTEPAILRAVEGEMPGRPRSWARATRLSVDYAVMERASGVRVVALDAGWDDVGSWDAAGRLREEQARGSKRVIRVDSAGSVVFGDRKLVALVDVPNIVVVDTPDALLVVSRDGSEKVRRVVDELARRGRKDLL